MYPENTLRAFGAAADAGAEMCEFDVRMTRDGEIVVIHDATVSRTTTGRGRVAAMSAEEVSRLDAGMRFGAEFAGERVPTLADVARALKGRCGMDVELKERGLERRVCDILLQNDAIETSIVSSFDWEQLKVISTSEPRIRIAPLADKRPAALLEAARAMGAFAIAPCFDIVDTAVCQEAHRSGLAVYTWTVDDPPTIRRLAAAGVDGIMTNDPRTLRAVMAA